MSEDMYFNAPYIGDPWIDSVSQQEGQFRFRDDATLALPSGLRLLAANDWCAH